MEVCKYGNSPEVAVALLQLGTNPNIISRDRHTALGYAVARGSLSMVELLLHFRVDTNPPLKVAPLIIAVERRDVEMVRVLLVHGADPSLRGMDGRTLTRIAEANGDTYIKNLLLHAQALRC